MTGTDPAAKQDLLSRLIDKTGTGLRRGHRSALLAAITGVLTGFAVAAFEWLVGSGLLAHLSRAPLAAQLTLPFVGLGITALALRWLAAGASPSTSEEYVKSFHDRKESEGSISLSSAGSLGRAKHQGAN